MIDAEKVAPVPLYHGLGYCKLIDAMGSDESVVEAARTSTGKGFLGWGPKEDGQPGDEKFLAYLWKNRHVSPSEMAAMVVQYEVPIFVERQMVRHRSASRNELSGRYSKFDELWWRPAPEDVRVQDTKNKQGSVAGSLSDEQREALARRFDAACKASFDEYLALIEGGMAREQARGVLPVAMMTRVRVSANLRNMLHMLGLRLDPHAQAETVELARAIASFVSLLFPRTWALFVADNECAKDVQPAKVIP